MQTIPVVSWQCISWVENIGQPRHNIWLYQTRRNLNSNILISLILSHLQVHSALIHWATLLMVHWGCSRSTDQVETRLEFRTFFFSVLLTPRYFAGMVSHQVWDNKALRSISDSWECNWGVWAEAYNLQQFRYAGKTNEYSERQDFNNFPSAEMERWENPAFFLPIFVYGLRRWENFSNYCWWLWRVK